MICCSWRIRQVLVGALLIVTLVGCSMPAWLTPEPSSTTSADAPSPPPAALPTSTSSSLPAEYDLFFGSNARKVVSALTIRAAKRPIVRVTVTREQASITVIDGYRPETLTWRAGTITASDDGADVVNAASFDPLNFNLDNVEGMFAKAAVLAGSDSNQELQITEYNRGHITMTVTTVPETSTVFFNHYGTLIPRLNLETSLGITRALAEVTSGRTEIYEIAIVSGTQLWVDIEAGPGILDRRVRPALMPSYTTTRRAEPTGKPFDPAIVNEETLAFFVTYGCPLAGESADQTANVTVTQPTDADEPVITITCGNSSLLSTLDGQLIK